MMRLVRRLQAAVALLLCLTAVEASPSHPRLRSAPAADTPPPNRQVFAARAVRPEPRVPTPADLYPRSLRADALYSYRGRQITTYWRSSRSEAVIVSHRAPGLRRIDYLAPDSERGRCVVADRGERWQYDPRSGELLHRRLLRDAQAVTDAARSYSLLRSNYILGVEPKARMLADRKAFVLTITRRSPRTLARRLWIDAVSGVVLKREHYREDGTASLTIVFSDIDFHVPLPLSLFSLSAITKRPGVRQINESVSSDTALTMGRLRMQLRGAALAPLSLNGYRLVSAALTQSGPSPVLHLRYSDGLNLVSLFEQRRTQPKRPTRVPPTMRKTRVGRRDGFVQRQAALTALNWDTALLNLTLMGEIAEEPLKGLARAVDADGPP